eukprot:CAMPEP_0197423278 /NCGR_PEP_ID=MMETSP1170-20131217/20596_1 /TAXON_ID=54406 /ORGANISM="Sarcinochrysis sp, Strain CCMP770" /LENGTH=95 /DNA_ID=CAMNT_0042950683 /DNA_START=72 /DNA_END=360 /DNA_ORIENTATION=+
MTMWHKMPFGQFLMYEITRAETWPFMVGMGCVLMMGIKLATGVTDEDRKNSKYYRQFVLNEGRATRSPRKSTPPTSARVVRFRRPLSRRAARRHK